jgi:hypothetical protein
MRTISVVLVLLGLCANAEAGGRRFYSSGYNHCQSFYYVPAVAVYAPAVTTHVSPDLQQEAMITKVVRAQFQQMIAGQAQQALPQQQAYGQQQTTQQPQQSTGSVLAAKCISCHRSGSVKSGLVLDGSVPITLESIVAFNDIFGPGFKVVNGQKVDVIPTDMKGLVAALTPQEKGQLHTEILALPRAESGTLRQVAPVAPDEPQPRAYVVPRTPRPNHPADLPYAPEAPAAEWGGPVEGDTKYNAREGAWKEYRRGRWVDVPPPSAPIQQRAPEPAVPEEGDQKWNPRTDKLHEYRSGRWIEVEREPLPPAPPADETEPSDSVRPDPELPEDSDIPTAPAS